MTGHIAWGAVGWVFAGMVGGIGLGVGITLGFIARRVRKGMDWW